MPPNFVLLDAALPEVARLVAAMMQARDAVERQSWSHPQEPTGEEWWADVLADPRARRRERRADLAVKQAFYRLTDEKSETILSCRGSTARNALLAGRSRQSSARTPPRHDSWQRRSLRPGTSCTPIAGAAAPVPMGPTARLFPRLSTLPGCSNRTQQAIGKFGDSPTCRAVRTAHS